MEQQHLSHSGYLMKRKLAVILFAGEWESDSSVLQIWDFASYLRQTHDQVNVDSVSDIL
jgi:hypothetical protein